MKRVTGKATRRQTRVHNSQLVLKTIYDHDQISRADVARETKLTRPTVSDVVADLMEEGLVEEIGYGPSAGGKPPILLRVVADSRHLIGIDLATREFHGAVVNLDGDIRHRVSLPLQDRDGKAAPDLVYELIDHLVAMSDSTLLGIGIGTPGLIDTAGGVVRRAVNLDWQDLPLRSLLHERYGLPVYVANDSQVAALAEYAFGERGDAGDLVVIRAEHGLGAGIVLGGQLFFGETFGAGEIGHVTVVEDGELCRCGHYGCLETVASVRAIVRRAQAIAREDPRSALLQAAASPEEIDMGAVCQALEAGDAQVREIVEEVGRFLGIAIANLIGVLSVKRILIAGSIACLGEELLDVIRREMVRRSLGVVAEQTEVGMSDMGADVVILGASALVLTSDMGLLVP